MFLVMALVYVKHRFDERWRAGRVQDWASYITSLFLSKAWKELVSNSLAGVEF